MPGSSSSSADLHAARVGQILDDVCTRRARGEIVADADVLAAYADLADELRPHLAVLHELRAARGPVDDLVARGLLHRSSDGVYSGHWGPYRVDGLIGRGGMGVVLQAFDESLSRPIALKLLRPELAEDSAAVTRFEREAKTAAALRHPNIVTIHAVGCEHGIPYIAMEYVDGPSLATLIRNQEARRANTTAGRRTGYSVGALSEGDLAAGRRTDRGRVASGASPDVERQTTYGRHPHVVPSHLVPQGLPPVLIRRIFRELLAGLVAAHSAGLIHRDIKSANILLDLRGAVGGLSEVDGGALSASDVSAGTRPARSAPHAQVSAPADAASCLRASVPSCLPASPFVKIADFGLARMRSSQTQMTADGSVLGTPDYMSPEQARGDSDIDYRTDLYSAGIVLYEMLTGRTPFKADTPTVTIQRILHEEPPDPRTLDEHADPVLSNLAVRLLAKRRENRFSSAADDLAAVEQGWLVRSAVDQRRLRWPLAGIGALAIVAVLAVSWSRDRTTGRIASATPSGLPITHATVLRDEDPLLVLVKHGFGAPWESFHRFPPEAAGIVREPMVLDLDGRGRQLIVVGTSRPLGGACLFAFDPNGTEVWRLSLTPNPEIAWPDVTTRNEWGCRRVTKGEVDGQPGDELLVVGAHVDEYPDRLSIVYPRTKEIGPTFWHMGNVEGLWVYTDFFAPGQPAIIAWAYNNKLDGFARPQPGDDPPVTHYSIVSAVMILDPRTMNGLGPPRTGQIAVPQAQPFAYAYLDLPGEDGTEFGGSIGVASVVRGYVKADDNGHQPALTICVEGPALEGARLIVDRNLNASADRVIVSTQGRRLLDPQWWLARWHPLAQNGKYLHAESRATVSAAPDAD